MLGCTVAFIIVTALYSITEDIGCALRLTFTGRGQPWTALLAEGGTAG